MTQSMESELILNSATLDPVCTLPSVDDCELKQKLPHGRASETNFISVSQIDRNQERVEEIHYSTGKDLSTHSSNSNSGLDEISLREKTTLGDDNGTTEDTIKLGSKNEGDLLTDPVQILTLSLFN